MNQGEGEGFWLKETTSVIKKVLIFLHAPKVTRSDLRLVGIFFITTLFICMVMIFLLSLFFILELKNY